MRKNIAQIVAAVGALHLLGWGLFLLAVQSTSGSSAALTIGAGVTAYTLGMRHAFDADHIAAIDNATRHLRSRGQKPLSVGLWFSLGHSTIVLIGCLLLAAGWAALASQISGDSEGAIITFTSIWGPTVAGLFLLAIGGLNLIILRDVIRQSRGGATDGHDHTTPGGIMHRVLGDRVNLISKPRHMYVVGFVFGLGFDTATSVGLLLLAAGVGVGALPWYAFAALPLIFAAGMTLFDSADGAAMNYAYGWADKRPTRRTGYNIVVTGVSVAVAFAIAAVNFSGIAADQGATLLAGLGGLNLDWVGFGLVAFFLLVWAAAAVGSRARRQQPTIA